VPGENATAARMTGSPPTNSTRFFSMFQPPVKDFFRSVRHCFILQPQHQFVIQTQAADVGIGRADAGGAGRAAVAGDGADGKMDRGTATDGNTSGSVNHLWYQHRKAGKRTRWQDQKQIPLCVYLNRKRSKSRSENSERQLNFGWKPALTPALSPRRGRNGFRCSREPRVRMAENWAKVQLPKQHVSSFSDSL
jgi:hypothetical protein